MNSLPVILAAGLGVRLGKKHNIKPKCLLKIGKKTLIENTIDLLIKKNFKKVIIIVGYKKKLIKKELRKIENKIQIQYVENKLYKKSGHGLSIYNAIKLINFKQNILIIHGDLFYDIKVFDYILRTKFKNVLLVDKNFKIRTKDEMLVTGTKKFVSSIQKYQKNLINTVGEIVGINLWSKSFQKKYLRFCINYFKKYGFNFNWEKILDEMIKSDKKVLINYKDINNKNWININYEEDIKIAKRIKLLSK